MSESSTSPRVSRRRWPRILGGALLFLTFGTLLLMVNVWSALGAKPSGERLARIQQSPQYRDGRFANTLPTVSSGMSWGAAREFFFGGSDYREPTEPLPVVRRTGAEFAEAADFRVTWLGHSTLLVELDGARILVDPVWGDRASPMSFAGPARFFEPLLPLDDLPDLDAIVISHDHYDHLDEETIRELAGRVPLFLTPLGVGAHLEAWGVDPDRITELDWWDRIDVGGIELVSTPARHFSGRFLTDRDATLWSGWAFLGAEQRIFYSGDTALAPEFAEIGERLGPFDLTLIESGAYNAAWADVHVGPEQAVQIHQMVRGGVMVPVHWGMFDLSLHGWTEPAERVRIAAEAAGIPVAFPRPGKSLTLDALAPDALPTAPWWPEIPWRSADEAPVVSSGLPDDLAVPTP